MYSSFKLMKTWNYSHHNDRLQLVLPYYMGRSFLLAVSSFYLQLVFVAYGKFPLFSFAYSFGLVF